MDVKPIDFFDQESIGIVDHEREQQLDVISNKAGKVCFWGVSIGDIPDWKSR